MVLYAKLESEALNAPVVNDPVFTVFVGVDVVKDPVVVFQIRPLVVTVAPPVFVTFPPASAVVCVTLVVVSVETTGKNRDVNET